MKKFTKKDYINIGIILIIFSVILFSIIRIDYVNGSEVDWESQHWIIPEYFRTLFYDTKDIFPSFAFNLGAGENIYNLSYYGLLSPIVLLSYLFPFINMSLFIQISMIIVVISSTILMYYFLYDKFDRKYVFFGTLLFMLSAPLIYHTHRHIMFINYMPFLLLALIGVDNYFKSNKKTLIVLSVFLIIMSSYYYSVAAIICIVLYGIYKYIEINKKITITSFLKDGFKFLFPIIVGISLSSVLILPTLYALLNGRPEITKSVDILNLLIPNLSFKEILYNSYTIGVTAILIPAIIYSFFTKEKNYKFLSIIFILIILFPIIIYILSGFMYVRGKVLIPLLPLAILLIVLFIDKLKINKKFIKTFVITSIIIIISILFNKYYVVILELLAIFIALILCNKYNTKSYLIFIAVFSSLITCLSCNYSDKLVTKDELKEQLNTYNYDILNKIIDSDDNIYRVANDTLGMKNINRVINSNYYLPSIYSSLENSNYYNLYTDGINNEMPNRISTAITSTKNILFNTFVGTKYMIGESVPIGYSNIENSDVYVNEEVLPIGYSTTKVINIKDYINLSKTEKSFAKVTNIITNDNVSQEYKSVIKEEKLDYNATYKYVDITKEEEKYVIESKNNGNINLKLNKEYNNKILFITFDMEYSQTCKIGDTSITINGVKNTLSCKGWTYHNKNYTFEYVISSNDVIDELNIEFAKGKYIISNIKVEILDYKYLTNYVDSVDKLMIDKEKTKGDNIFGNINVKENGYFVLTIPYEEKGFTIYLDDKEVEYEKINDTFIGFKINEGYHEIKINYTAPYLLEGLIVSICGCMITLPIIYSDIFKKKRVVK